MAARPRPRSTTQLLKVDNRVASRRHGTDCSNVGGDEDDDGDDGVAFLTTGDSLMDDGMRSFTIDAHRTRAPNHGPFLGALITVQTLIGESVQITLTRIIVDRSIYQQNEMKLNEQ